MSAVVHMYYATSTAHVKQIIKLGEGKYIQLDSYSQQSAHLSEPFIDGCFKFFIISMAAITVGAALGTDVTKLIQMPSQPTQPTQPLKP